MKLAFIIIAVLLLQDVPIVPASIEGVVIEPNGFPVEGARVGLTSATGRGPGVSAVTDIGGKFAFPDIPPGDYRLSASREGYVRGEYGQTRPGGAGIPLTVVSRERRADVAIVLTPTGVISGRVYDSTGQPLAAATVYASKYDYEEGQRILILVQNVRTDAAGDYRLSNLQPGRYAVSVGPSDPSRLPVYFPGTANPAEAGSIEVLPAANISGLDFSVVETKTVNIRGVVLNGINGKPPTSVTAILFPRQRAVAAASLPRSASTTTGTFEILNVAPGAYDLVAAIIEPSNIALHEIPVPRSPSDGYVRLSGHIPLEIGESNIDDIELLLRPGVSVNGRVTWDGLPLGTELPPRMEITLRPKPVIPQLFPPAVRIAADGTFVINGVLPGEYQVSLKGLGNRDFMKEARLGGADLLASNLRVDNSSLGPLEIRISSSTGMLTGVVVDERRRPLRGMRVVLVPEPPNRHKFDLYWPETTNDTGQFKMDGIVPGDYKLFAWDYVQGSAWQDPDFLRLYERFGKPIRIEENSSSQIEIERVVTVP